MNHITIDFETFYSKKLKYSLKGLIAEQYCQHHLFDPYMVSVYDGKESWVGSPKDFNWNALDGRHLVAHNSYFEQNVVAELIRRQMIPKITPSRWSCTANMTAHLCQRRSIDQAVEKLYGVKVSKDARANAVDKRWPDDFTEEQRASMAQYALHDAIWCWRLYNDFGPKWTSIEQEISRITIDQGIRGVRINRDLLMDFIVKTHDMLRRTEELIPWIKGAEDSDWEDFFDEANVKAKPTSTKCIAEQCRRSGIPCAPVKSEDLEAYELWEATYSAAHPWIKALGSWRSLNKLYKTFLVMKDRLRSDDTMPFSMLYFGAHCITGDSELLTKTGWVKVSDWNGGEIAQWAPDGSLDFKPATPNKFHVSERLLQSRSPYFSGNFTLGHTMPIFNHAGVFETIKAESFQSFGLKSHRTVPISGCLEGEGASGDELSLLAAVQADGYWEEDGVRFNFRKQRKMERLERLLTRLDIRFTKTLPPSKRKVGEWRYYICNGSCPAWLTRNKKVFGPWLLSSSLAARKQFLEEILLWDGHTKTRSYYTSVEENARWVEIVAHISGCAAHTRIKPGSGNRKDCFETIIRKTTTTEVRHKHLTQTEFSGNVYCPTTQTGFFLYRHGGKIAITGNTGRVSATAKVNLLNQRKKPIFCNEYGFLEENDDRTDAAMKCFKKTGLWPEWVRYTIDFRNLIIPRAGKKMIVSDLAQIEPRVLAWLTKDTKLFEMLKRGLPIYEAHARNTMKWVGSANICPDCHIPGCLKHEDADLYQLAKVRVLGLGYGAGWEKFITMAKALAGLDLTKDDPKTIIRINQKTGMPEEVDGYGETSRNIVNGFRADNKPITDLWKLLDEQMKRSNGQDFVVTLPSGRKMTYERVRGETRIDKNKETQKPEKKVVYTVGIGNKRVITYGGKLTENVVQATARDVFYEHVVAMDKLGWDNLFGVYDEAVLEVNEDVTVKDVVEQMSRTPEWLPGCPIGAEAKEVPFYQK